jgi:ABC-type nickel/cobalt efflux system permease component RcnA
LIAQSSHCRVGVSIVAALACAATLAAAHAHDVPDRFFDRAVQVTIHPDRVDVDYQLSLTRLTLAEELLALVGPGGLAGAGPEDRMDRYGKEMGPLLARGLILRANESELSLQFVRVTHRVDDHPRFAFVFAADVPPSNGGERRLAVEDTSFYLEKGRMRIAVQTADDCTLVRSNVPANIDDVQVKPSWQMSPEEQDLARRAEVTWTARPASPVPAPPTDSATPADDVPTGSSRGDGLLALLDRWRDGFFGMLLALAFFFGAAHAMAPGHSKTMIAAYLVGERGTLGHAVGLGLTTSLTHTSSVLAVAVLIWLLGPAIQDKLHAGFSLASGGLVALLGACLLFVRLRKKWTRRQNNDSSTTHECGGHSNAGGNGECSHGGPGWAGLVTLGISGGIVPCWDAVVLLLIATAQGQIDHAVYLLLSFSAGLAAALVAVGVAAVKLRRFLSSRIGAGRLVQSLPVVSAAAILGVGLYLCALSLNTATSTATLGPSR